jgi:hypothetical protein
MKKNTKPILLALYLGLSMSNAHATPASTDYVNTHLHDAMVTFEQKMNIRIHEVTNEIQQQIINGAVVTHHLGENHQGGVIFWLDDTNQHGLIAARIDANEGLGMQWQNGESGDRITNARANGIRGGLSNTQIIIAQQTADDQLGHFAALVATSFSVDLDGSSACSEESAACFSDWYLPSLFELKLMNTNLYSRGIGNLVGEYWSSNEKNVNHASSFNFDLGQSSTTDKSSDSPKIRPIRVF